MLRIYILKYIILVYYNNFNKNLMKTIFNLAFIYILSSITYNSLKAQNIGINGTGGNAHPSALLDIDAVATPSLGVLIPRIALQAVNLAAPISSPATSLLLYNTATASSGTNAVSPGYYYWDGAKWVRFNTGATPSAGWDLLGNAGTIAGTNFTGTTDAVDWVIKTNNTEKMRVLSNGNVAIGTTSTLGKFDVVGGRSYFAPVSEQYGVGVKFVNSGGAVYIGATSGSATPDAAISNSGGATLMTLQNGGNVGIGITVPAEKLDVLGNIQAKSNPLQSSILSADGGVELFRDPTSIVPSTSGYVDLKMASGEDFRNRLYYNNVNNSFGIMTSTNGLPSGATERFTILNTTGNIGIGTTTPGFKLHVPSGGIGADYLNTTDNAVTSGVTGIMVKQGDNYLRTANAAAINTFLGITAPTGDNLGNHTATTILNMNNNYIDNAQGSSRFAQSNNTTTDYANAPIQIREAQYAGGLAAKAPRLSFHWGSVVASQIGLESTGRIAILNNPGTGYENLVANEIYSNSWFRNINSGTGLYNEANATGIFSPSAGIMAIYNNGSLGIGTTAPAAKLHIVATSTNTGFQLQDGSQGTGKLLVSDANGKASWASSSGTTTVVNSNAGNAVSVIGVGFVYSGANATIAIPGYYIISTRFISDKTPPGCGAYIAFNIGTSSATPTGLVIPIQDIHQPAGGSIYDFIYTSTIVYLNAGTYYFWVRSGGGCTTNNIRTTQGENSFTLTLLK